MSCNVALKGQMYVFVLVGVAARLVLATANRVDQGYQGTLSVYNYFCNISGRVCKAGKPHNACAAPARGQVVALAAHTQSHVWVLCQIGAWPATALRLRARAKQPSNFSQRRIRNLPHSTRLIDPTPARLVL
jgi:hypothetical protein